MAATLLTAIFMAAAVSIVSSLARTRAKLAVRAAAATPAVDPLEILRLDLTNARAAKTFDKRVVLLGYSDFDFRTLTISHHPVEITYELRSDGRRNWLIRTQRNIDALTNRNTQSQPLAVGVTEFRLDLGQFAPKPTPTKKTSSSTPPSRDAAPAQSRVSAAQPVAPDANLSAVAQFRSSFDAQPRAADAPPPIKEPYVAPLDPLVSSAITTGGSTLPARLNLLMTYDDGRRIEQTFFIRCEVLE
jgi:hypothetical protein